MQITITPGKPLRGVVRVPGDKSLSHRAVLFAAMADGESRIRNFLVSGVTRVMLDALTQLGVHWDLTGDELVVYGKGLSGWRSPGQALYCGNSATTIRLLAGAIAAAGIPVVLDGSPGLRRRPMDRILTPLRQMGVDVDAAEGDVSPLSFRGRAPDTCLKAINMNLPVASAQVKTCLLLAALATGDETVLVEPGPSRDHTERMLGSMGVDVTTRSMEVNGSQYFETRLTSPAQALRPISMTLPGDISAAAFLIVAGLITPGSELWIPGVGLNPTRTGLIDALLKMGADIRITNVTSQAGEPVGDLEVRHSHLSGTCVSGSMVVRMIDEFSVFGVAGAYCDGMAVARDAQELRYKESDRISTLYEEMRKLGVNIKADPDGFRIYGGQVPSGGLVAAHDDHRLEMGMSVLGLASSGPVTINGAEMIDESFPGFVDCLRVLGAEVAMSETAHVY